MKEENNSIQSFENKAIRTAWNEEQEEWYFSVTDIVAALTDSADPKQYIKKMRSRDPELNARWGTICTLTVMTASDGKKYRTNAANLKGIFRIIQSIPSPKAEPLKQWLSQVGSERIEETIDPELTIERALETYEKKGYTREWINQRLQAIQVRKELTDEWKDRGVKQGKEFAILTDEITRAWAGMSTRQYKKLKGLKKENLRDNMTTTELVLNMLAETSTTDISKVNMLAETSTTDISKEEKPATFSENRDVAKRGGNIAGIARKALEQETGKPVISPKNAAQLNRVVTDMIEEAAEIVSDDKKDQNNDNYDS